MYMRGLHGILGWGNAYFIYYAGTLMDWEFGFGEESPGLG